MGMAGIFEEMDISGNLDFLYPSVEGEQAVVENEGEVMQDDDYSEEDMDVDELERRIWRDRMRLRRLQEQSKGKESDEIAKLRQSQEQARRKKMSRAQDGILKYMLKMEVCEGSRSRARGKRAVRLRSRGNLRRCREPKMGFSKTCSR